MGCRWIEALLAIVIIVFTKWSGMIFTGTVSMWIVIVSAVLLLLHALFCKHCNGLCMGMMKSGKSSSRSGRRRRR